MGNGDKKVSGTCQVCFSRFAVKGRKNTVNGVTKLVEEMVHHGYKRPGHGYIVGDCWGVGKLPYELDVEVTKSWHRELTEVVIPSLLEAQKGLKQATELTESRTDINRPKDVNGRHPVYTLTFVKDARDFDRWDREKDPAGLFIGRYFHHVQADRLYKVAREIQSVEDIIDELEKRIRDWVYAPERLVETERNTAGPLIHASRSFASFAQICGRGRRSRNVTSQPDAITCPDCRQRNHLAPK